MARISRSDELARLATKGKAFCPVPRPPPLPFTARWPASGSSLNVSYDRRSKGE